MKVHSSSAINLIDQQFLQSICPYWVSLTDVPDFRKKFSHFRQDCLMLLKIAMKIEKFHFST